MPWIRHSLSTGRADGRASDRREVSEGCQSERVTTMFQSPERARAAPLELWLAIATKALNNLVGVLRGDSDHGPDRVGQGHARDV